MRFIALVWMMMSCTTEEGSVDVRCEIQVDPIIDMVERNAELTIDAHPMTDLFDTHVQINQTPISATGINKSTCSECDLCREENGCTDCAYCATCADTCSDCRHTLTVEIPSDLPVQEDYWLTLYNSLGSSEPVQLFVQDN